jgi:hypothetical protein
MGEKKCRKCGETVEEAKAFCPGCGEAFVEEKKRSSVSDFDLSEHTVRLGDTMYNQMLSDMGLSISKQPNREQASLSPLAKSTQADKKTVELHGLPVASEKESRRSSRSRPTADGSRSSSWLLVFLVGAVVGIVLLIALGLAIFFLFG